MTARDRLVVMIIAVFAVLGAAWLLVVSPERKQAAALQKEVNAASSQLAGAEGTLATARGAEARYSSAYTAIVRLGKAVPPGREVPSLVYQLAQASNERHVDLSSIVSGSGAGSSASTEPAATTLAGFTQMPFTFVFNGNFKDLYNLFTQLNRATVRTTSGGLQVSGRLLTIQSAKLAPVASSQTGSGKGSSQLTGTITATAYVLPAAQGLTGGGTPAAPGSPASAASSTPSSASSPTAPAIARVTP